MGFGKSLGDPKTPDELGVQPGTTRDWGETPHMPRSSTFPGLFTMVCEFFAMVMGILHVLASSKPHFLLGISKIVTMPATPKKQDVSSRFIMRLEKFDHEAAAASLDSWDWGKYPPKGWTFRLSKFLQFVQMGSDSLCSKLSRPQWQPWHFQLQIAPFLEPHLFLNYQHLWKTISWKYWTLKHTLTKFGFWKHQTHHFFPPKFLWIQPHLKWGWFMAWRFTSLAYMEYVSSPKR